MVIGSKFSNFGAPCLLAISLLVFQSSCVIVDGEFRVGGPEVVGQFQKTVTVDGSVDLEVKNGSGDTKVYGSSEGQVRVEGKIHVRAGDKARGEEILAQLAQNPPISQFGRAITIGDLDRSRYPRASVSFDFTIFVPKASRILSRSGSGDQSVQDIDGDVELAAGSGDLQVTNIGGRVEAKAGSSDIHLRDIRGDCEVSAGSGDVEAENLAKRAEVRTGSGSIRLSYVGDDVLVQNGSGGVTIREAKGGIRVRASSGDVLIDSVLTPGSFWDIETASGDVDLKMPQSSQFNIHAESRSGSLECGFPVQVTDYEGRRSIIKGSVGHSSCRIRINTVSGRVRLLKT